MGLGQYVRLKCKPEVLDALAGRLTYFAPADGEPDWLTSGVWLGTETGNYLATSTVEILPDGFVARSLSICSPADLAQHLETELPNIADRLVARGNGMVLPPVEPPSPPQQPTPWSRASTMKVIIRVTRRASTTNRVACGLLFAGGSRSLLVGSDPSTLALVLSEEPELIDRYCRGCELLTPTDYQACG